MERIEVRKWEELKESVVRRAACGQESDENAHLQIRTIKFLYVRSEELLREAGELSCTFFLSTAPLAFLPLFTK